MDSLLEKIFEWIRQGLIESIMGSFTGMFDTINQKVGEIAGQVGQTPEAFNSGVFSMIRNLSETAVLPIAGMILTFVMCYELITMITEKNNMHDFDTFNLYKWVFKTFVAVYILGLVAVLYGSKRLPFSPQTTPAICGNARQISLFATEAMTLPV